VALFLESDRVGFLDATADARRTSTNQQLVVLAGAQLRATPSRNGRDWDALDAADRTRPTTRTTTR
jgi:hypothetical protein